MKMLCGTLAVTMLTGVGLAQISGQEIVDRVEAHYRSLPGCSVTLKLDFEFEEGNPMAAMLGEMNQTAHGVVIMPNVFAFWSDPKPDGMGMGMPAPRVISDGKTMTSAIPEMQIYEVADAPASFAATLRPDGEEQMMPTSAWQLVPGAEIVLELMSDASKNTKPADEAGEKPVRPGLLKSLASAEYKGKAGEDLDTHHVFLVTETDPFGAESQLEVHVAAAGKPWVIAVRPIPSEQEMEMFGGMTMTMRLTKWAVAKELPAVAKIDIGEDWTKVDDLMDQLMNSGPGGNPFGEDEPFVEPPAPPTSGGALGKGDAAANFTLASLGGGEFTLADHLGKVVVVDFWATWCPPCVAGLPVVSAVTKELESKGVVFIAVDLDEPAAKVQSFMDKKNWDFPVALDPGGKTATAYGVTGIPHSLVIDKKGVIRHVHIGFGGPEQFEAQLRKELNALIDE